MSVERAELEIHVRTSHELAGARQGATALEAAIGHAKAVGREYRHLEKQLARVRNAILRFHLARRVEHGGRTDADAWPDENEVSSENPESAVENGESKSGSAGMTAALQATNQTGELTDWTDERPPVTDMAGAGLDDGADGQEPSGTGIEGEEISPPEQGRAAAMTPAVLSSPSDGQKEEEDRAAAFAETAAAPESGNQHGAITPQDIVEIVRQMLEEHDASDPTAQLVETLDARMTAWEAEMESRLGQIELQSKLNRNSW